MRRTLCWILTAALLAALTSAPTLASEEPGRFYEPPPRPWESIDVAILLDTSQSMQPLIDATRLTLWEMVNDLVLAEPMPTLRVALLTYGMAPRRPQDAWVTIQAPLTSDLDVVSSRLFDLAVRGSKEYVARTIQVALDELEWTESDDALKLIFIAGNESAQQDPEVNLDEWVREASRRGVNLNAIYCGPGRSAEAKGWKEMAVRANGQFAAIHLKKGGLAVVETPFDQELAELSRDINETYLPFGQAGEKGRQNQVWQDKNARKMNVAVAATRAQTKASPLYTAGWDLVDLLVSGELALDDVDEADLPDEMRLMSLEEREVYVDEIGRRREELRGRIMELSDQRRLHVSEQLTGSSASPDRDFNTVLRTALRRQAQQKGFTFPEN